LFAEVDILSCVKDTPYRDFEDLIETMDNIFTTLITKGKQLPKKTTGIALTS
jgi:hypothetical protein